MGQDTFLYTVPQWFTFASVIAIGYGWVEKKRVFSFIGVGLLLALGCFALFAVLNGYFAYNSFLSPEEIIEGGVEGEVVEDMPLIGRILPAYWLFLVSGILSIPSFFLELKKNKYGKTLIIITALVALSGFFIIVSALKM